MIDRALVTGGAGFIGSHLVDSLLDDGCQVIVIDDLSTGDRRFLSPQADLRELTIVDAEAVDEVVRNARPEVIFHLAAQASVTSSVAQPMHDCMTNVIGTFNVLQASVHQSVPVVFSSTGGALYGNEAAVPTSELHIPAPLSPYGASKWAGESYVSTWGRAHRIPHTICRLGNVYGPRQNPRGEAGVVSILAHRIYTDTPPQLFGHGRPTRDYISVSDVVHALKASVGAGGVFNISTGEQTDVLTLWEMLARTASTDLQPRLEPLRAGELESSGLDPSRASALLGWKAKTSLKEGLESTYHALLAEFEELPADA